MFFSNFAPGYILDKFPFLKNYIDPLISSPIRRRLSKGAFWGGIAAIGSRIVLLATSFFLARILGQRVFGEYGMVNSTAGMIGSFAGLGLGLTVTKYIAELKVKDPDRAGRIIALSSVITALSSLIYAIALVVLAKWLAEKTLAAPHLTIMLQISAITAAMGVINGVQTSSLIGLEAFMLNSFLNIGLSIIQSILVVLFAWKWGLKGAIIALAAAMCISVIITRIVARREWLRHKISVRFKNVFSEWHVLVNFSLPSFLTLLLIGPVYWICNTFLANQPGGYFEMGIFNAIIQWQTAIGFLPGLIGTAMVPVLSEKIGNNENTASLRIVKQMTKVISFYIIPTVIVLFLVGPWILKLYGAGFVKGYRAFIFLVLTGGLAAVTTPATQYIVSKDKMWLSFWISFIWAILIISLSYFGSKSGAQGLALGRLVAQMFHSVLFCYYVFFKSKSE